MVESLSIIPKMWTEKVFFHEGHYYQIPPREIVPTPIQQPHPPMWAACTQEETQEIAGGNGYWLLAERPGWYREDRQVHSGVQRSG